MNELILTAATALSVTPIDVYVIAAGLVLWIVFLALGLQKTYEAYFGLIVGLAIYLMLTVLLSPAYQTPETAKIFSPGFSKFLIGSSTYLIFILFLLTPISGGVRFPETKTKWVRLIELGVMAGFVWALFFAILIGFASKTYVFGVETAFRTIQKMETYQELMSGVVLSHIAVNIQPIVLFGVLFLLYKMLFSDFIGVMLLTVWYWILSLRNNGATAHGGGHDDHGGGHDDHGHDDDLDMHLDDHGHDDHGHDSHGHGGHH